MNLLVFENLFYFEKRGLLELLPYKSFSLFRLDQLDDITFLNFLDCSEIKILFINSRHLNRKKLLLQLAQLTDYRLFQTQYGIEKFVYLPSILISVMCKIKCLKQFNFFIENHHAKYFVIEGKLNQNQLTTIIKFFSFWLVCVVVAFFWEIKNIESHYSK